MCSSSGTARFRQDPSCPVLLATFTLAGAGVEESGERVLGPARLNAVFSGTAFSQTRTEIGAVAPIYRTTHEVRSLRFLNIKIDRLHIPGFRRDDHFN